MTAPAGQEGRFVKQACWRQANSSTDKQSPEVCTSTGPGRAEGAPDIASSPQLMHPLQHSRTRGEVSNTQHSPALWSQLQGGSVEHLQVHETRFQGSL